MDNVPVILLIDDNEEDAMLTEMILKRDPVDFKVVYKETVEKAEEYLFEQSENGSNKVLPSLILLDLKLPVKSGADLLNRLKGDPARCVIPIVVLTNSSDRTDVNTCYFEFANSYVKKAADLESFREDMRKLTAFWFRVASLPNSFGYRPPHAI